MPGWWYIGQCLLSRGAAVTQKDPHLDTLLSSIKLFSNFVLTNASNVSKGQRNFGILVTSQWLEWIPIILQCTFYCYIAQLNKDVEQFCVDCLVKYFKRSTGNSCSLEIFKWPTLRWLILFKRPQWKIRCWDIFVYFLAHLRYSISEMPEADSQQIATKQTEMSWFNA